MTVRFRYGQNQYISSSLNILINFFQSSTVLQYLLHDRFNNMIACGCCLRIVITAIYDYVYAIRHIRNVNKIFELFWKGNFVFLGDHWNVLFESKLIESEIILRIADD